MRRTSELAPSFSDMTAWVGARNAVYPGPRARKSTRASVCPRLGSKLIGSWSEATDADVVVAPWGPGRPLPVKEESALPLMTGRGVRSSWAGRAGSRDRRTFWEVRERVDVMRVAPCHGLSGRARARRLGVTQDNATKPAGRDHRVGEKSPAAWGSIRPVAGAS